ncbi:MAG: preprotein translocase subunit YajC [Pseudomonadota bacterium]|nr:preprotein translocase subunit YajC [Pseudomonadota bacterium]|tara:strand:+ start:454 stop:780 length:327 start_codon:yes stop_codon:yes gene_type:complete
MDFIIANAYAQTASESQSPGIGQFIPLILLFVVFYIFLIRPQMKRQKEHTKMINALKIEDEVVTNGGLLGKIKVLEDSFLKIEISKDVEVKVQRQAIAQVVPKGTIKQ